MAKRMSFIAGVSYVIFFVGLSTGWVGDPMECEAGRVMGWDTPFKVLLLMGLPFALGVLAGKDFSDG